LAGRRKWGWEVGRGVAVILGVVVDVGAAADRDGGA